MTLLLLLLLLTCSTTVFAQESDSTDQYAAAMLQPLEYRMVGPFRGGRVTAVAGTGGHTPTLFMGSTGGGIWRSTNNGLSYANVSDGYFEVGSIGAIAIAPADSNVVYVGTGSAGIRSNVSTGKGVYKSLDQGASWIYMGLPEAGQMGEVAVHPQEPDIVFVAALGHVFGPNPERGVFRSIDGGNSWEHVLYVSDSTGAASVVINPENPDEIFASMWRAERKPWTIISGGVESGVYKSVDGGDTWTQLTEGLPSGVVGKIDLAISPVDPSRIYALLEAPDGKGGLYRSDDGGASFAFINDQKSLVYRPFYYTHVHADPVDASVVYVSNESFFKSTNGGKSFASIRTPHGDHHALWINPDNNSYLFQGNDGGATVTLDGGNTWSSINNQATGEFYHVVVDNQFPYNLYGEQQDNTTIMIPNLPPTASRPLDPKQNWREIAGCETGPIAVHPNKPNIIYGGCKGRFSRYNLQTGQEKQYWVYPHFNYGHAAREMPYRFQRTAPIELSPHNPDVIYHASQYVHKTTNEGVNWTTISPDLTAFEPDKQGFSGEPITRDITGEEVYSAIYQIRESIQEEGVIWTGSNDGLLFVTQDGGTSWNDVTPDSLPPGGRVQTIDPSPHRAGSAYAAIYRYMLDDWQPYIYHTDDYGETWQLLTDSSSGMPMDHPTRVVREDPVRPGLLYAGTEFGLFISFNNGTSWQPFQQNLPATPVTDIRFQRGDMILSTMGRAFWIMDDLSALRSLTPEIAAAETHLFKPEDIHRLRWTAARVRFDGAAPEYPDYGIAFHYALDGKSDTPLRLTLVGPDGETVRTFTSDTLASPDTDREPGMVHQYFDEPKTESTLPNHAGLNRFVWDLRHYGPASLDADGRGERGPLVAPGKYRVELQRGEDRFTQSFDVLLDPRVAADEVTPADISAQTFLSLKIRDQLTALRKAVAQIRQERQAIKGSDNAETQQARLTALNTLEEALIQTREGKVGAQLKPKLMRQFTYLYGMLNVADQRPGEDAYLRLADLESQLDEHLISLNDLLNTPNAGTSD
ncbi:MAG: hypothetical protein AAF564_04600 [Bacteroidota bacterium]